MVVNQHKFANFMAGMRGGITLEGTAGWAKHANRTGVRIGVDLDFRKHTAAARTRISWGVSDKPCVRAQSLSNVYTDANEIFTHPTAQVLVMHQLPLSYAVSAQGQPAV